MKGAGGTSGGVGTFVAGAAMVVTGGYVLLARAGRAAEARPYLERFAASAPPAQYARDIREISAELAKGR